MAEAAVKLDRREVAGAVADVGVLVPIATALIVSNGLSATAVLLPAGLLYLTAAAVYRLPVPVQPLKAFGAIAIANGLGSDVIAAGALLMGVVFLVLGRLGVIDRIARFVPHAIVRGVQLTVGLLFLKIAWGLVDDPPKAFRADALDPGAAIPLAAVCLVGALLLRRRLASLVLVSAGLVLATVGASGDIALGPSPIAAPDITGHDLATAFTILVLPQLPLTFANSCVATSDAARTYFGDAARRVTPGRLATTLGLANLLSSSIAGMPVCHGAGGMTAHRAFGARSAGAPLFMGTALLVLAIGFGSGLAVLLAAFPLPILAALLGVAGLLHIALLRDLHGMRAWGFAIAIGVGGVAGNLAVALGVGLILWWLPTLAFGRRPGLRQNPTSG